MKNVKDLLKKNDIIRVSPEDTLSQALGQLSSSHDAAFVMDEKDNFLGVINPYYALIQSSAYDGDTKVENCLFHPPKINENDTLGRIASMMTESKVHYLPVFNDKNEFVGITSGRRLLALIRDSVDGMTLGQVLAAKNHPLVSIDENESISKALALYKDEKVSKLVVVNNQNKVTGLLSYYELIPYLIAPGKRKKGGRGSDEQEPFQKLKVKNYAVKTLLTLQEDKTVSEAIDMMLKQERGSVVVVDSTDHPKGIVTTRNILELLQGETDKKPVQLTSKNFNEAHISVVTELVDYVFEHIQNDADIRSAEVIAEEAKEGVLFRVAIHLIPEKGKMIVYEREGKDLPSMLRELKGLVRQEK